MNQEIKEKILALLDQHRIMTVATVRADGWPQATTVGYVNEGLTLYFLYRRRGLPLPRNADGHFCPQTTPRALGIRISSPADRVILAALG